MNFNQFLQSEQNPVTLTLDTDGDFYDDRFGVVAPMTKVTPDTMTVIPFYDSYYIQSWVEDGKTMYGVFVERSEYIGTKEQVTRILWDEFARHEINPYREYSDYTPYVVGIDGELYNIPFDFMLINEITDAYYIEQWYEKNHEGLIRDLLVFFEHEGYPTPLTANEVSSYDLNLLA